MKVFRCYVEPAGMKTNGSILVQEPMCNGAHWSYQYLSLKELLKSAKKQVEAAIGPYTITVFEQELETPTYINTGIVLTENEKGQIILRKEGIFYTTPKMKGWAKL